MPPTPLRSAPICWWWIWASGSTFLLGVAFMHVICGFYLFFLPDKLPSKIQKTSPRPASERVSWCLETSSIKTPFPGRVSVPSSFVSLSFIFCPTSFRRQWAAFLGTCCPQLPIRSCFVKFALRWIVLWWICRGESGLPSLFLRHLGSSPVVNFYSSDQKNIWLRKLLIT